MTVSPALGFEITSIQEEFKDSRKTLAVEHQMDTGFGFFPKRLNYTERSTRSGRVRQRSQVSDVEVVAMNRPVSTSVFTFKEMGVPVGHRVDDLVANEVKIMTNDGPQIALPSVAKVDVSAPSSKSENFLFLILIANGVVLILLSVVAYLKRRQLLRK